MKRSLKLLPFTFFCLLVGLKVVAQNSIGWSLVWSDEFDRPNGSSPDPAKWVSETGGGGWGNHELQYYTARTNNARIENGQLVIEALQENYQGSNYTSARLKTQNRTAWRYGRIEARIRIPRGQGIWPAFWTLGTNISSVNWPNCGEIDIMENIGKEPTLIHGTIHGPGYSGGNAIGKSYSLATGASFADDFHVFAVEWTTNQIKWSVDGQQYFSAAPPSLPNGANWVFTQPQFLLLNLAVGGQWPGNPDGSTVFPQRLTVDYVRVYAPTNLPAAKTNALANPGFEMNGLANWTTYGFNTSAQSIKIVPVHNGSNTLKVFGQFNGAENYSGVYQDVAVSAGQSFSATGWVLTPSDDRIANSNTAWIEVSFRNASANALALYRTALINSNTAAGSWLKFSVTNQLNPGTSAVIGAVTNLIAPPNTAFLRYQIVFRQLAQAGGSVLFDDLKLASAGTAEFSVPTAVALAGNLLNLEFPTYLAFPYQVCWKTDLTEPDWTVLTNLPGDGQVKTLILDLESVSRFFRVTRQCN